MQWPYVNVTCSADSTYSVASDRHLHYAVPQNSHKIINKQNYKYVWQKILAGSCFKGKLSSTYSFVRQNGEQERMWKTDSQDAWMKCNDIYIKRTHDTDWCHWRPGLCLIGIALLHDTITTHHFPGQPRKAGSRKPPFWISLEQRWWRWWWKLELYSAKLQSNCHHQQTNIQLFYRPDALPVAQPAVSEHWRQIALHDTESETSIPCWKMVDCWWKQKFINNTRFCSQRIDNQQCTSIAEEARHKQ